MSAKDIQESLNDRSPQQQVSWISLLRMMKERREDDDRDQIVILEQARGRQLEFSTSYNHVMGV